MNNVNYGSSASDPRTTQFSASFNAGAKKNVVGNVGAVEADSGDMSEMTQPTPNTVTPLQRGSIEKHYDEPSSRPVIPAKVGPMQQI